MASAPSYEKAKLKVLADPSINKPNKDWIIKFLEYEEYKLKRQNNLPKLDDACYKTLVGYIGRLRNVILWFDNKPLKSITKADIKRVYDGLEDGDIVNRKGEPFKDRVSYYNKIFKSKPFDIIGKAHLAKEIIEFTGKDEGKVQFIEFDTFKEIVKATSNQLHKLLLWLSFDYGENVNSLLQLKKSDFTLQKNPDNNEDEYRLNFRKEILKRSRMARSELTNHHETVKLLNQFLPKYKADDLIFDFDYDAARKVINRSGKKVGAKCIPDGSRVTYKVLRSSMACYLLKEGWTRDEINARLGHKPSSTEIDKYINFLAIDRHKPKKKLYDSSIEKLTNELEATKRREKLTAQRLERQNEDLVKEREKRERLESDFDAKMAAMDAKMELIQKKALDVAYNRLPKTNGKKTKVSS